MILILSKKKKKRSRGCSFVLKNYQEWNNFFNKGYFLNFISGSKEIQAGAQFTISSAFSVLLCIRWKRKLSDFFETFFPLSTTIRCNSLYLSSLP